MSNCAITSCWFCEMYLHVTRQMFARNVLFDQGTCTRIDTQYSAVPAYLLAGLVTFSTTVVCSSS